MPGCYRESRRCALIIGHPGHELRVWGWMRLTRPLVAVLTDGAGHHGRSRLDLSRTVCTAAGATPSEHFGLMSDADVYQALLDGDVERFTGCAAILSDWLIAQGIEVVAGDAVEGYNPTHDLCRAIIDAAVRQASIVRPIETFAFDLTGRPGPPADGADAVAVALDAETLAAKLDTCESYGRAVGGTLLDEIHQMLAAFGSEPFGTEYLRRHDPWTAAAGEHSGGRPFYETYGEQRVSSGHYQQVIRQAEHLEPVQRALRAVGRPRLVAPVQAHSE